jgi:glycerate 2-kinase
MLSAESFLTSSLRGLPQGQAITRILAAAINSVEPGDALGSFVRLSRSILNVAGHKYDLGKYKRVSLLGIGKASVAMAQKLAEILGPRLDNALVITKHVENLANFPFPILQGDHPIPGMQSLLAGKKAVEFVSSLRPDDLLCCLISGGGSALVTAPLESLGSEDLQALTSVLLACGARIDEINSLRRRLDLLKGGGLVRLSNGATIVSLILSDVVGNPLEVIASGPTAPDPTTRGDAMKVLKKYGLPGKIPALIQTTLEYAPETPKPGDPIFEKVQNVIVGSSLLAAQAALAQAEAEGFHPHLLRIDMQGEARQAGSGLATFLRQAKSTNIPVGRPACIIAGGETTVTLHGKGKGGRNTELALAAVAELVDFPGVMLITLATDGEDGPTDAAGAVVNADTFRRAAALGYHPSDFLERNDSYTFFASLNDLLKPGPTGTNVNDLVFLFAL